MNSYGQETYTAKQITDVFAQSVASGKVTTAAIGSTLANVAPVAAQAGIGLEEVGAAYAVMTAKGFKAEQVTTDMQQAIVALISPNEALNRVQARTGINFAKLAREKGLAVALQKLRQVTGATGTTFSKFAKALTEAKPGEVLAIVDKFRGTLKLTKAQADAFKKAVGKEGMGQALSDLARKVGAGDAAFADSLGRVQAYQFALATTGDSADEFGVQLDLASKQLTEGGLAAEQAAIKMDSPVEAGKRIAATFKKVAIEAFGPFADSLGPAVIALNQTGGAMGALIRPATLVGGIFGKLASSIVNRFLPGITKAGPALAGAGAQMAEQVASGASSSTATGAMGKSGRGLGMALKGGMLAIAGIVVFEVYDSIVKGLDKQTADLTARTKTFVTTATVDALKQSRAGIQQQLDALGNDPVSEWLGLSAKPRIQAQLDLIDAELKARSAEFPTSMATGIGTTKGQVAAAMSNVRALVTAELDKTKEVARLKGELSGKFLANALRSKNPEIRAAAESAKRTIEARLAAIQAEKKGQQAAQKLATGLKSPAGQNAIQQAIQLLAGIVNTFLRFVAGGGTAPTPPKHASGGYAPAGQLAMFGEYGPELGVPRAGYDIQTAPKTRAILESLADGGSAGGPLVGSMTINNPVPEPASVSVPKALRRVQVLAQLG
jgi:hypothetical protein